MRTQNVCSSMRTYFDMHKTVEMEIYYKPINKCFKSYPVLSLRRVPSISITVPLAKTTSRPTAECQSEGEIEKPQQNNHF